MESEFKYGRQDDSKPFVIRKDPAMQKKLLRSHHYGDICQFIFDEEVASTLQICKNIGLAKNSAINALQKLEKAGILTKAHRLPGEKYADLKAKKNPHPQSYVFCHDFNYPEFIKEKQAVKEVLAIVPLHSN